VYQWSLPGTTTTTAVSPAGLEFPANPTAGQQSTFPGPIAGTTTMQFMGVQAPITNPAGTWNNVVMFQFTNSPSTFVPPLAVQQNFMVKGVGPVRIAFPAVTPALTCDLTSYTLR
jgi:hypothetical protein